MMNTFEDSSLSDLIFSHLVCHWGEGGFDGNGRVNPIYIKSPYRPSKSTVHPADHNKLSGSWKNESCQEVRLELANHKNLFLPVRRIGMGQSSLTNDVRLVLLLGKLTMLAIVIGHCD